MNELVKLTCCICGNGVEQNDSDAYTLQVTKFGTKSPAAIWAHGPCLRKVIPVVGEQILS